MSGGSCPRRLAILVVSANAALCSFLHCLLSLDGHAVTIARDAIPGIRLVGERDSTLILLDLGLPVCDGFDFLAALRDSGAATPVIVIGADTSLSSLLTAMSLGVSGYFTKPLAIEELRRAVQKVAEEPSPIG